MGDPAGIGPEIAVQALSNPRMYEFCRPLVVGDAEVMRQACEIVGSSTSIRSVDGIEAARFESGAIDVLDLKNVRPSEFVRGEVSAMAGKAAFEYISMAISLALEGIVDATVTAPIHKEALNSAGYRFAGHTEIYRELTNSANAIMMLAAGSFRVVHVSTHVSLRRACELVSKERVLAVIREADRALKRMGLLRPRIAVAGLNPHAGEKGLFGDEETKEIIPAIEAARADGLSVEGPFPPDTIFAWAKGGHYDVVVAMYHDQGHIPVKLVSFQIDEETGDWASVSGVNITLGLPIIRVSVDHGVAFDRAGKGTANCESLVEAIELAARFARGNAA